MELSCPTGRTSTVWSDELTSLWDEGPAWVKEMEGCIQDPIHHAEGDVWTHTLDVVRKLMDNPDLYELAEVQRLALYYAAVLHDIAKPLTRTDEGGRISHPHHSVKGAQMARNLMWEWGVPFLIREAACHLIRWHQTPYHLIDRPDPERTIIMASQMTSIDMLSMLALADTRGRKCQDESESVAAIEMFHELALELGCPEVPYDFANDHTRVSYFRKKDQHHTAELYDNTRSRVTLMCGLPGAGKSHWILENLPCDEVSRVSLDDMRRVMGVKPGSKNMGTVVQTCKELAKGYLRRGNNFVWDSVNLDRARRQAILGLFYDYKAHVRIVYCEAPPDRLWKQNQDREDEVPESHIRKLLRRWEVPTRTEAHQVLYVTGEGSRG